jgi:hypothetical protein
MPDNGRFGAAELETLFRAVADHLDAQEPDARTRFMCRAFFLLAEGTGNLPLALEALKGAAETTHIEGRIREIPL